MTTQPLCTATLTRELTIALPVFFVFCEVCQSSHCALKTSAYHDERQLRDDDTREEEIGCLDDQG